MLKDISVFDNNSEDSLDWPPESPKEFLEWFSAKFNEIPEEHKHTTVVCLSGEDVYDEPCSAIDIYYYRPETEDETKTREESQEVLDQQTKARELRTLNTLMVKYYGGEINHD